MAGCSSATARRVGWDLESTLPGQYAVVIEDGQLPRAAIDQFARRITDEHSLIPAGQAVLRPATWPTSARRDWRRNPVRRGRPCAAPSSSVTTSWPRSPPAGCGSRLADRTL